MARDPQKLAEALDEAEATINAQIQDGTSFFTTDEDMWTAIFTLGKDIYDAGAARNAKRLN